MRIVTIALATLLLTTSCADGDTGSADQSVDSQQQAAPAAQLAARPGSETAATPGVSVVGEGRVSGTPDTLRATVGVEVVRSTVDEALSVANERAAAVIDAVIGQGVAEKDIQTRDVSVRPRFAEPTEDGGRPSIEGYVASNLVEVKIRDVDAAGDVLQAVAEAGGDATRIRGVSFALEDNQQLLEAAREAAFQDARDKADQYAALADRELGRLVAISEQTTTPAPVEQFREGRAAEQALAAPPVQPGQQEVVVRVQARWSLG